MNTIKTNAVDVNNETAVAIEIEELQTKDDGDYSPDVCQRLEQIASDDRLIKKYRASRYERGKLLRYHIEGVFPKYAANTVFKIEKFIGGGFAGQVYRVRLLEINSDTEIINDLKIGSIYAIKILVPPSGFACFFRNFIYWLAYQGPFSAQVNYAAARTGVLWQKLIRRGAKIVFGTERAVVDTYATFFDYEMHSYGEINEWVQGRNWKFEIDDTIFKRKRLGVTERVIRGVQFKSAEYLAKKNFMNKFVKLFHEMGAPELARQYEWWTMKSQPNALLRLDAKSESVNDLVGIDFRAGLALVPFLPMSPADIKLIIKGLLHGKLVQFDRGNVKALDRFIEKYNSYFTELIPLINELKESESRYRRSLPDLTHHGLKLIVSRSLRKDVRNGLIEGYLCRELIDEEFAEKLKKSSFRFLLFYVIGVIPLLGKLIRKLLGNKAYAKHVKYIILKKDYFKRMLRAKQAAALIDWFRDGRVNEVQALKLADKPVRFWFQKFLISWLPPTWHRFFTDAAYAKESLIYAVTYPIKFYRDNEFREQWLLEQVKAGEQEGMITSKEAADIRSKIKDPFIQKYLKCVAVHVCTLPITQVVSVIVAIYTMIKYGNTLAEGLAYAGLILAAFQATPVSPGSLTRGLYVLYLMIKERDVKNYWVAAVVSFWHYIGYLGFPIQMVAKFPALSRLMAGRWATNIVHIIPVFGERGALLEHWVFDMFFNVPISVRRWFKKR